MYQRIKSFVESSFFTKLIIYLIVLNGITMGLETSKSFIESFGTYSSIFNKIVISVFTIEIILRIYVYRVSFFKDSWSLFDFFVVTISLIPASQGFEILRVLRVLRLFRLITAVPQMRKIVTALISVIPGMLSVIGLMTLFFYIFAIMATQLFAEKFPEWFGTLGESFYTLFQIMTLESWSMGIVRPVMEIYPYSWLFFVPFIFIVTFVMINLVVAIIVDAMAILNKEEEKNIIGEIQDHDNNLNKEIVELRKDMNEIKLILKEFIDKK
ncbi:Ion transport protein [Aliarcobacter thereius]|uniref:Ion transport protein n=1 Tax=Aliarcobacter thereius LMG 24486 TaxID=1032240 RepID=A0A1C7WNY7_9BACT|nr:ion transporter [Aliarcobacter thereius]OCL87698.1 Ion transport protein [Aliarcobacter thereius]OCL95349.1 Ion transport protein [Aliarcobacter thereius LMG 24486]QBF16662.1 ion transporter [Aliarcobacter thereius LMG 24486]TLS93613.1 ion transporter [Aliarcobacter thereius]TLT08545.1 ion transporter [Aliarcobacter thereius]